MGVTYWRHEFNGYWQYFSSSKGYCFADTQLGIKKMIKSEIQERKEMYAQLRQC